MGRGSSKKTGSAETLDRWALNRALLARQMLLARREMPALDAVEHLAGMQSQAPNPPYVGLWTRLEGFRHDELSALIRDREAVRIVLMRSTIHLVSADDCLAFRPVLQPVQERTLRGTYGRHLDGLDPAEVAAAGRALVEERPRTSAEVGAALAERWPGRDPASLGIAVRAWVPLVQVPPRGLWSQSGPAAHTSAEHWLGRPLSAETEPDALVLRYLAAFGPASPKDMQTWCGLTGLRAAFDRLRPRLATFRAEHGAELFDLPDAPRPDGDTPAPPRFLPPWDNLLLSHADRGHVVPQAARARVFTVNGVMPGTVLVDGFVRATWKVERQGAAAALVIEPTEPIAKPDRAALADEGARLLAFTDADAASHDVRFAAAP